MWGCALRAHPHISPHSSFASSFFSRVSIDIKIDRETFCGRFEL